MGLGLPGLGYREEDQESGGLWGHRQYRVGYGGVCVWGGIWGKPGGHCWGQLPGALPGAGEGRSWGGFRGFGNLLTQSGEPWPPLISTLPPRPAGGRKQALLEALVRGAVPYDVRKLHVADFVWVARERQPHGG